MPPSQVDGASHGRFYCTLFDMGYLTRGLALYESLIKAKMDFRLFILCMDQQTEALLQKLNLKSVTLIALRDVESPELLAVKASRSRGEYCWTCTPHIIEYCLRRWDLPEVTYLDADLFFFQDPEPLFLSMGDADVFVTPHYYSPAYDQSLTSGIYCVQFMCFKNTENGRKILNWWAERCREWCFAKLEDGKFGDQKYLDDWTSRFSGVHSSTARGAGLAPWNQQQYNIFEASGRLQISFTSAENSAQDVYFYHFHALKLYPDGRVDLGTYKTASSIVDLIYTPYLRCISRWERQLAQTFPESRSFFWARPEVWRPRTLASRLKRALLGTYNIFSRIELIGSDGSNH